MAALTDCELVEKATPEARDKLLHELAAMQGHDMRKSYAMQRLEHNGQVQAAPPLAASSLEPIVGQDGG